MSEQHQADEKKPEDDAGLHTGRRPVAEVIVGPKIVDPERITEGPSSNPHPE